MTRRGAWRASSSCPHTNEQGRAGPGGMGRALVVTRTAHTWLPYGLPPSRTLSGAWKAEGSWWVLWEAGPSLLEGLRGLCLGAGPGLPDPAGLHLPSLAPPSGPPWLCLQPRVCEGSWGSWEGSEAGAGMGAPGTESGGGEPWPGAVLSLCSLNTGSLR